MAVVKAVVAAEAEDEHGVGALGEAVTDGVHWSAGSVKVPLALPEAPYTTQFFSQAASPLVTLVCQQSAGKSPYGGSPAKFYCVCGIKSAIYRPRCLCKTVVSVPPLQAYCLRRSSGRVARFLCCRNG